MREGWRPGQPRARWKPGEGRWEPLQGPGGERRSRGLLMSFLPESQRRDQHPRAGGQRDRRGKGPGGVLAVGRNLVQCQDS